MAAEGSRPGPFLALLSRYQRPLLGVAVVLMMTAAALRLPNELHRLTLEPGPLGGIDLLQRHGEVQAWFEGRPVYGVIKNAAYPPATYLMLWPFVGWTSPQGARWIWAALSLTLLIGLAIMLSRLAEPRSATWRRGIVLFPLAGFAGAACIGNGQLSIMATTALLASLLILQRPDRSWWWDLGAAALFVVALMKPSIAAPFFWLAIILPNRVRPALLILVSYGLLTVLGASFQDTDLLVLLGEWWSWVRTASNHGAVSGGYGSHVNLLRSYGIHAETRAVSLLLLALAGVWAYRNRRVPPILLIGAMAVFARLWTYHRLYDDIVVYLGMAALFQIARHAEGSARSTRTAAVLLLLCWIGALAPARVLRYGVPWDWAFASGQSLVWSLTLLFLLVHIHRARTAAPGHPV